MTTVMPKEADIERKWFLVDANDRVLGRLATEVAMSLLPIRIYVRSMRLITVAITFFSLSSF